MKNQSISEQRLQAYLSLIQALLDCLSGQEAELLKTHQDLIDCNFVSTIHAVANQLKEDGQENSSQFLLNVAKQLLEIISPSSITLKNEDNITDDYIEFLMILLETIAHTRGDPQVVYPFLQQNLDKINKNLGDILSNWSLETLANASFQEAEYVVSIVGEFSNLIQQFPLGNRAINIELAITGYQIMLTFYNRENFPEIWVGIQNNLGNAYLHRTKGERGDNLEQSIAYYYQALEIYSRETFPTEWAMTQLNLGRTFDNSIRGDRAENLEQAIAFYQNALSVYTRQCFPEHWASVQNSLGNTYADRILGERAENLEEAINCYQKALEIYTREAFPEQWAVTQNNLAAAYSNRIKGEKADNIEQAIAAYQAALEIRIRAAFPEDWARTQNNLANAYSNRIKGEKADNIEQAIAAYQAALEIYTRAAFPQQWAMTQNNLANAYSNRIKGEKADNIEQAITAYQAALEIRTRAAFPEDWARTQNNLANAYHNRIKGGKADNIKWAIACYNEALIVRQQQTYPQDWAMTNNNLGNAYSSLATIENTEENLKAAIACFQQALEIRNPKLLPLECLQTASNLGNLAFKIEHWQLAIEGYSLAIEALELTRSWSKVDDNRQDIIAKSIDIYNNIIESYINLNQYEKALEYVERSRSKQLVDLMASNDLYAQGEISLEIQKYLLEYEKIQQEIERTRYNVDFEFHTRSGLSPPETIKELEAKKQEIWQKIRLLDPVLSGQIQVEYLSYFEIQKLIDNSKTAILDFYTTANNTYIFIIKQNELSLYTLSGEGYDNLQHWILDKWLIPYVEDKRKWLDTIPYFLIELSQRLEINNLVKKNLDVIEEIIIIPHLYLHQIPFAALPLANSDKETCFLNAEQSAQKHNNVQETFGTFSKLVWFRLEKPSKAVTNSSQETDFINQQYLIDQFIIRYVPSCQILKFCQDRPLLIKTDNIGIVGNANDDLIGTEFECEIVAKLYNVPDTHYLRGSQEATIKNYQELAQKVQTIHFSSHGCIRLDNPLESALILGNGRVTLGELLTPASRLPNLQEVFLSACETGLGLTSITDDILTFGTGFLCAGARTVISTLWAVDDLASALLSIFYYEHQKQGLNLVQSLRQAQLKLRNLTGEGLKIYLEQLTLEKETDRAYKSKLYLKQLTHQEFPFASPYYWAGFICQGIG